MFRRLMVAVVLLAGAVVPGLGGTGSARASEVEAVSFAVSNPDELGAARVVQGTAYGTTCTGTVVLLQHGLSYTAAAWDVPGYSVVQPLVDAGYAVVSTDRLGYGRSPLDDGTKISTEAYADITRQIVEQLRQRFDRVVLAGHSAGAEITMLAAGLHGAADAIAVLGYHHYPSQEIVTDFFTGDIPRSMQDDYEYFLGTPEHRREMFYEASADPAVVDADMASAQLTPSGEIRSIGKQPSRYVVGQIDVPVFLQLASHDRLFEAAWADEQAALFASSPSITVDLVPDAGHTFMLHPSGVAGTERLVTWLSGRPEAPRCTA